MAMAHGCWLAVAHAFGHTFLSRLGEAGSGGGTEEQGSAKGWQKCPIIEQRDSMALTHWKRGRKLLKEAEVQYIGKVREAQSNFSKT